MSSVIFNPAMLTASPSPSPKPEECPQVGGDVSTNDATLDDTALKEPEESDTGWIDRAWAVVLNTMHVCVDTSPPSKPELLEEQECWLRDWNTAMSDMTSVFDRARAAEMHLLLNDVDAVTLAEGKIAAWTLTRAVKMWKEKAEESTVTAHPARVEKGKAKEVVATKKTAEKATEKLGEKATEPVLTNMGCPHLGGRMTATSVSRPAESQAEGARAALKHARVVRLNKRRAPAVPKRKALKVQQYSEARTMLLTVSINVGKRVQQGSSSRRYWLANAKRGKAQTLDKSKWVSLWFVSGGMVPKCCHAEPKRYRVSGWMLLDGWHYRALKRGKARAHIHREARERRTAKGDNVPIQAGQPMWAHGNKCTMLDEWAVSDGDEWAG
ncbi:uncharacterized protein F5147DRAFT_653784 [Suillus discolor]|uniref:Uncharacterized protein n=1 Tax=Suillus discolor TaxID=1912936 RepID=A0A9P7F5E3_9AGAM|nr:uncharacterized protein F5147DRAFT_653784 [Suillus discolor]KAG2106532.1 hypothetical protein F5147DRAFT_653784 [Suillus discolor]